MIVRDEEKVLPRCLESVQSVADELVVVDTGSKDNTISIAKDFGAKVFHFKWCDDFAAARNESLKHATSDWILQIDADEELLAYSIQHVKSDMVQSMVLQYVIRCDSGPRCRGPRFGWIGRLFRGHPKLRYDRPYHEGIDRSVHDLILAEPQWQIRHDPNIIIRHYGYEQPETHRKHERGLRIMKSYLEENPNDGYILAKLGEACGGLGRYEEAEAYLNKALEINPNSSETNFCLGAILQRQKKLDAAVRCYKKAIASVPDWAEAYSNLGALYMQKGMLDDAILELRRAVVIRPNLAFCHSNLAIAYCEKGNYKEAIKHCDKAMGLGAKIHPQLLERLEPYRQQ
jgi:tetratricopeptide (TPR) repeat protein